MQTAAVKSARGVWKARRPLCLNVIAPIAYDAPRNTAFSAMKRSDVQSLGGLKAVVRGPRLTRVSVAEVCVVCMADMEV